MKTPILYLSHSANLYGSEQSLLLLIQGLNKKQFSPIVVLPTDGPLRQLLEPHAKVEIVPSLQPWLTWRRGFWCLVYNIIIIPFILWSIFSLIKIIKKHKVELIHTNSLVMIDGALAAKIMQIPHVWHARELLSATSLYPIHSVFGRRQVIAIIQNLSSFIIANSDATLACFPGFSLITTIYNPVSEAFLAATPNKTKIYTEFKLASNILLIGQAGHITSLKGYDDFITAAAIIKKSMPHVHFFIAGSTPKSGRVYEKKLRQMIIEYNLQETVHLVGYRTDIVSFMSALDVFVLASHSESFGRALVEASAIGIPVIGTNVGGIPEIVEHGVTGFIVPPYQPEKLAKAILLILKDPKLAHQMGQAGKAYVKQKFSSTAYISQITALYEQFIPIKG